MPATSRSGECLARLLLEAVLGIAFKIDDDEIIAGDQHLSQVIVAVDADLLAMRLLCRAGLDARQDLILLRQDGDRLVALRRHEIIEPSLQHSKRAARLVGRSLAIGVEIGA